MQDATPVTTARRTSRNATAAMLMVMSILACSAVQAQSTTPNEDSADSVTLNFQDADIRALINTVSQITGQNFVVDPRVKGRVTLVSGTTLPPEQIYDVFLTVLEVHNFAAVPAGDVIKIVPSQIIKQQATPTIYNDAVSKNDEQITQVYQLRHGSVQELIPILRPLMPPTSHFAAHPATNTLVFTDTAANIGRILGIIARIDQPDRRSDIHVVYLQHASAAAMAQLLAQLASSLQKPGDPNAPARQISVQADPSTNAVIIQSPESEFGLLQAVIEQLDIERNVEGDIHVVYLRYAKAVDLVGILNDLAQQPPAAEGGVAPPEVSVQADEDTNALVIRADEESFRELEAVIEKLDIRRSQVFVETIIAEVSYNKASELGVEWNALHRTRNQRTGEVTDYTGNLQFSPSGDSGFRIGIMNEFFDRVLGEFVPDLDVVLRALRSDSNTNILSTPNLLTLDNEAAEIIVGQEVPFITGQFVSDASSTTIVDTPGPGGTGVINPFQTIERKDVGLTLRITPQINEGGAIRLEIENEISSVSPITVQGASDLITDTRSIMSTVQVEDGQIIVLGGLIRDDVKDTFEWVPVLSKIPLIGALFRKKTKSAVKTNLMVFLRPRIVRSPGDLADVTKKRYDYIKSEEALGQPDTERMIEEITPPILPNIEWEHGRK